MVRTGQQALKHLLEQKVGTPFQQRWITKLLGFDFHVEYRSGKGNKEANALSRRSGQEGDDKLANYIQGEIHALSIINVSWWEALHQAYNQDPQLSQLLEQHQAGALDTLKWQYRGGFLFYKGKLHLGYP